ncbi:MAG: hypothetical protein HY744_20305 [Deltaproteobacteria bacterium]|nr:hypothetical protein [Deltaproteobacteria bacterium]
MRSNAIQILAIILGAVAYLAVAYFLDRSLGGRFKAYFRYLVAIATAGLFFYLLGRFVDDHDRRVNITKAAIALTAAAAVFYEQHRQSAGRPIAERWKRFAGVVLALAAICAYFNGFRFGYPPYYHRWDQYHYYMGSKYYRELSYDGLYKCAVVAQDELGLVAYKNEDGRSSSVDMRKEVRDPDKKVRNLGGDNLLMPVRDILLHPEQCRDRFTKERWEQYKADVKFFRIVSGKGYWLDMQKDHGFNPPPVWTILGKFFGEIHAASVQYNQALATLDLLYLGGMFVALWWAFGWRVFAVGAIFWGCQSSAPFYWTGGALLRQDWLFYTVLSVCCIRKRCFKLAGAALVYSGLLRIFPGLVVLGTLVPVVAHIVKHRRLKREHGQMLLGGTLAAALLVPASLAVTNAHGYQDFYRHTLQVHDQTPLTNHMGLQVLIAQKALGELCIGSGPKQRCLWGTGKESGRMKYTRDNNLTDPFEIWKRMRNERYAKYRAVAWAIVAATLAFFIPIARRVKLLWIAQCLGQIFIILLSQLTCYYYSFMILGAPLSRLRKQLELWLFGLAAVTQIIWLNSFWNDDKYTALTYASLVFCCLMLFSFWRRRPTKAAAELRPARADEGEHEAAPASA